MLRVQSLQRVVVTQFATILLPLVGLIAFHVASNANRTAELDRITRTGQHVVQARDLYVRFANGAADAVDRGRLSKPALEAMAQARDAAARIEDRPEGIDGAVQRMAAMLTALEADPSLETLMAQQPHVVAVRHAFDAEQSRQEALLQEAMSRSIEASRRDTRLTVMLSLVLLGVTLWFVRRMVKDLSRPLGFAVSVADRIARREAVADAEFEDRHDVGNLLRSLGSMNRHLRAAQDEVEVQQRGLEVKVRELSESRASLDAAQRLAQIGNWHWNVDEPEARWSQELYRVLGMQPGQCPPRLGSMAGMLRPDDFGVLRNQLRDLLRGAGNRAVELESIRCPDGVERALYFEMRSHADASGRVTWMHGIVQDVSARRAAEARIRHLALFDGLTDLPNRANFSDRLTKAIARARRTGTTLATLFIDLDRFKRINDTLGHDIGDQLLKEAAQRLRSSMRESDEVGRPADERADDAKGLVARLGGDEFTAMVVDLRHPQDAARVAARVVKEMSRPVWIEGHELVVTASVGIAVYPNDGDGPEALLKKADAAMYRAKELGKNGYQFYADDLNDSAVEKLALENELRRALERHQFVLHFQPKVDVGSGHIAGVEALIRWNHPHLGLMAPGKFIGLAEETGLIVELGNWVLDEACRHLARWRDMGLPRLSMALNLASPSFRQADLEARVSAALKTYHIEPHWLQLEATESILMSDANATMHTLRRLRELGVKLAIDDFGTGYSSLSYLRRFPIDQLKVDRSFVKDMTTSRDDAAITSAIVSLAQTLELDLVAEGVETLDQARALNALGCTIMQGYYFAHPMPAAQLEALLRRPEEFAEAVRDRIGGLSAPMPLMTSTYPSSTDQRPSQFSVDTTVTPAGAGAAM